MPNTVLVFVKRILPQSLTFVADQGHDLPTMTAVYAGLKKKEGGLYLLQNSKICIQEENTLTPRLSKLLLETCGYINPSWKRALQSIDPSITHAHFGKGGYYAAPIAKALNTPLIVTFHGSDITQKNKRTFNQRHRKKVFSQANKIIAVSKFIQNTLINKGCPDSKIIQHYTGINTEFFTPNNKKSDHPTILFIGRLIEQKGCHILLQAMQEVQKTIPDVRLIVAGDGNQRANLEQQASNLKTVAFIGSQDKKQIKALLDQSWVMCAPSIVHKRGNEEGLGTVFLEAQAMSTPVVSFNTGGIAEAVKHEQTGLLVEPNNIPALADALITLLRDNKRRITMGSCGVEQVRTNFNAKKQCAILENIYTSLR